MFSFSLSPELRQQSSNEINIGLHTVDTENDLPKWKLRRPSEGTRQSSRRTRDSGVP